MDQVLNDRARSSGPKPDAAGWSYLLVTLIGFFGIASTTLSKNPVLPLYVQALGADESLLGVIAAVSPLAGILFSFPVGVFSDRLGRRRMLRISALVFTLAPLLYLIVHSPGWLIPVRFFHGLATAILGPVAAALIVSLFPGQKGARLGIYSSVTLVGRTLAPLLGGVLIAAFAEWTPPLNYQLVYVAAFLLSLPILIAVGVLPEQPAKTSGGDRSGGGVLLHALREFLRAPVLLAVALADLATYFAFGVLETYLPLFLRSQHIGADKIGLIFSLQTLALALTKPVFGRIADRWDSRRQILLGLAVLALSLGVVPFVTGWIGWTFLAVLFGLGMSFSTVATSAYAADLARRDQLGAALGALSSIMDIGHSAGPLVTGFVIVAAGFTRGFQLAAAVCVLALVWFGWRAFRKIQG